MTINGVELEFNCFEEESNKKVERALKHVVDTSAESRNKKRTYEEISTVCKGVKEAFDIIFGQGTGEKVCGKENDLIKCVNAFAELIDEKNNQEHEMNMGTARLLSLIKRDKK